MASAVVDVADGLVRLFAVAKATDDETARDFGGRVCLFGGEPADCLVIDRALIDDAVGAYAQSVDLCPCLE